MFRILHHLILSSIDENSGADQLIYTIVAEVASGSNSNVGDLSYNILGEDTEFLTLGTGDDSNKVGLNVNLIMKLKRAIVLL